MDIKIKVKWKQNQTSIYNINNDNNEKPLNLVIKSVNRKPFEFIKLNLIIKVISGRVKFIDANIVTSKGIAQRPIFYDFKLPIGWPLIWKVNQIKYEPMIKNSNIVDNKINVEGSIIVNLSYFYYDKGQGDVHKGSISFIEYSIPFATDITIDESFRSTIKGSDKFKLLNVVVIDDDYRLSNISINNNRKKFFSVIEMYLMVTIEFITIRNEKIKMENKKLLQ